MRGKHYILFAYCLTLCACGELFVPEIDDGRTIVIECALEAGEDPSARIHITNSIVDTSTSFFYPMNDQAIVKLVNVNNPDPIGARMAWDGAQGKFVSESTPIIEGETYFLSVVIPDMDVDSVSATTTVPFAVPFESVEYVNPPLFEQAGDEVRWTINVQVEIPESVEPFSYYQLVPEIVNGELASQGIIKYDQLTKNEVKVLSENSGVIEFIHKNGIFIDNSRLDDNTLDLEIIFILPVLYQTYVDSVTFALSTINREYMVYHENTDREIRVSSLPLDEPQISATNIENGYGLYGAFSSSKITLPLQ